MCFAPQRCALFRHLNSQKWSEAEVFCTFWLRNVLRATMAFSFSTSQLPKVVRTWFCTFWLRHVLRATTACAFSTSQLLKVSEAEGFCTCWLRNVLRATTARAFSTSQFQKVFRTWCALCILTCKCASRHNDVQFFISHLASWLRTHRFSAYFSTFRSPKSLEKHSVSRLSYLFAHLHLLSSDSFSCLIFSLLLSLFSLPLPCSAFHLSILSEVWLLNFLRSLMMIMINDNNNYH